MAHQNRGFAATLGQTSAFINSNSNPKRARADTYVKSCKMTLAGLNGISVLVWEFFSQARMFSTSAPLTEYSSQFLTADSKRTLIEYGRVSIAENKVNKVKVRQSILEEFTYRVLHLRELGACRIDERQGLSWPCRIGWPERLRRRRVQQP